MACGIFIEPSIFAPVLERILPLLTALALLAGCATAPRESHRATREWPRHTLRMAQTFVLNPPGGERFDASGLLFMPDGSLLTVNDRGPQVYRIDIQPSASEAGLTPLENLFKPSELAPLAPLKLGHYDCEGLAIDDRGRIYLCEEANRWILRCDPKTGHVERLPIDWAPVEQYFSSVDANASFEGIAVGRGKLYVANERSAPRVIVVDLESLRVTGSFQPLPRKGSFFGTHYSDLCWFEGNLWVLCRQHRVVLEVNPDTREVLAEFDYEAVEDALGYRTGLPVGIMEGLAVDRDWIWLVTDNNGLPRKSAPRDIRPMLVKCPRPDRERSGATRAH